MVSKLALKNIPDIFIIPSLIVCLLAGSNIGFGTWFIHNEYTALYLYQVTALLLIIGSLTYSVLHKKQFLMSTVLHFSLTIYSIYIIVNGLWIKRDFNTYHEYLLISYILAITLPVFISHKIRMIFASVLIVASAIASICLLQALKFLPSLSVYFDVTGTFSNPNITAMFLSLALCSVPLIFINSGPLFKKVILIISCCILLALWSLHCRTAWIGLFVWGIIQADYCYDLKQLFGKYSRSGLGILSLILGGMLLLTLSLKLYKSKEASAEGRKLIWKISAKMIAAKPLAGFGYGQFERQYNIYQAKYFAEGKGSIYERERAAHVNMAYNELIQHGVEGGLIGTVLFAGLFIAVFLGRPKTMQDVTDLDHPTQFSVIVAYSGIMAFLAMSLVNFTVQAIPVMVLFVVYLAIFISGKNQLHFKETKFYFNVVVGLMLLLGTCFLFFRVTKTMIAAANNKRIVSNPIVNLNTQMAKMDAMVVMLHNSGSFWKSYGDLLLRKKHYKEALSKYNKAIGFSSGQGLYLSMAICYEKLGQMSPAINSYHFLSDIQPLWLKPRIALLKLYEKQRDSAQVIQQAIEILAIIPKIKSTKVTTYKKYAQTLLEKYQPGTPLYKSTMTNDFLNKHL